MKWTKRLAGIVGFVGAALCADEVELQDGTRIEGTILAENPDSIEIQTGANETGTIRRVLIIDSREIRTWSSDRRMPSREREELAVGSSDSKQDVERLIEKAQNRIEQREIDAGIREFGEAADLAGRDLRTLDPEMQAEMLQLRAYAYRLQLVALETKAEILEEDFKRLDKDDDDLEDEEKELQSDIEEYRSDKKELDAKIAADRGVKFGSKPKLDELQRREAELMARKKELDRRNANRSQSTEHVRMDLHRTKMQIELVEEKVDRAEDEAKRAEKAARRR